MTYSNEDELFKATMLEVEDRIRIRRGDGITSEETNQNKHTEKQKNHPELKLDSSLTGRHTDREVLNCTIDIAEDAMTAYLMLYGKPDGDYTYQEIEAYLQEHHIVFGIREKVIRKMISERQYYEEIIIARGTSPAKGKNGYFEFHFDTIPETKPIILPDGSVDYNKLGKIELAETGQLLATYHSAVPATNGTDILGNTTPIEEAIDLSPLKGKGFVVTQNGLEYYASTEGKISYSEEDHQLSITPIYTIDGNVDAATGDINFNGDVLVKGNVFANTTIHTTGTITVNGHVEIANLYAGKNVILKNGMQGSGIGTIKAKGQVMAKFLEQTNVIAGNSITANALLNCNVESGTEIIVSGNRGSIIGGTTKAVEKITAYSLGNRVGVKTKLIVGFEKEFKEIIALLDEELALAKDGLLDAERSIARLTAQLKNRPDPVLGEQKAAAFRDKITYQAKLKELTTKKEELIDIRERSIDGTVIVSGPVNAGTTVIINGIKEKLISERKNVNFTAKGREMRVYSNNGM